MLSSLVFPVVAVLALAAAWAVGISYLDVFTPDEVRAWRKLASFHGIAKPRGPIERIALRISSLQRLQVELDLTRLLAIANRDETSSAFLIRTVAYGLAAAGTFFVIDLIYFVIFGDWILGMGLWVALPIGIVATILMILDLRREAKQRQDTADKALGDMMMLVAILTDQRGLQLEDAVKMLSRCLTTDALESIVEHKGYTRLVTGGYKNTPELYRKIADAYDIMEFVTVADAITNTNIGLGERDTYTRLAKSVYQRRLADARMKSARAKILVTVPIAGMLFPLLILIGAPAISNVVEALH